MSSLDLIPKGLCPNKCGDLTILKKPVAILYLLSEDLLSLGDLEGTETPESMFGYIKALCPECGFVGVIPPTHEYDYENGKWRISTEEAT
jgi:hypothetical protein